MVLDKPELARSQDTCDFVNVIMSIGKERISRPVALVCAGEMFFHSKGPRQGPNAGDDMSQASTKRY